MSWFRFAPERTEFALGESYTVEVYLKNGICLKTVCKFIKVTKTGYNFLNEKTSKCIFKKCFYPNKDDNKIFICNKIRISSLT